MATALKITGSWGQSHPAPHTAVRATRDPGLCLEGLPGPPARSQEDAVEVYHVYTMQTTCLHFFNERRVANSPCRLYMENCLSNSQTLSQLNGCITKDLAEPPLRLSHFRYFQSWAFTNIAYMHSCQINKSCVYRYLHVSLKIPMC